MYLSIKNVNFTRSWESQRSNTIVWRCLTEGVGTGETSRFLRLGPNSSYDCPLQIVLLNLVRIVRITDTVVYWYGKIQRATVRDRVGKLGHKRHYVFLAAQKRYTVILIFWDPTVYPMAQDKSQLENVQYTIYEIISVHTSTNTDTVLARTTHIGSRTFESRFWIFWRKGCTHDT